ncbi:MAG: protein-glutamate O-methyltransferase CheR [Alcanivorax sp.]|nr:protein-glutamate O-methyltransferase CheR [Alcanivorax sp.]
MSCINETNFNTLRDLLCKQVAINLTPDKAYLAEARLQRLALRHTHGDINALIEKATQAGDELRTELMEAMAIHETYFFRDPLLSESIVEQAIPALIKARQGTRILRIWSAACSTGQEPYSVAMMLAEHFPELNDWDVRITASDFSGSALDKARRGSYAMSEVNRGLPARLMARYFQQSGLDWEVKPEIRERLDFQQINLVQAWPDLPMFDLVLIRNVLIYFSEQTRQTVLARIRKQTRRDGYLLLGATENLDAASGFVPAVAGSHRPFYQPSR